MDTVLFGSETMKGTLLVGKVETPKTATMQDPYGANFPGEKMSGWLAAGVDGSSWFLQRLSWLLLN